jgi:hypothetical protein
MRAILLTLLLSVPSWAEGAFGTWKVIPAALGVQWRFLPEEFDRTL